MAGLPAASWLLLFTSFGVGLAIELAFLRNQRRRRRDRSERGGSRGGEGGHPGGGRSQDMPGIEPPGTAGGPGGS